MRILIKATIAYLIAFFILELSVRALLPEYSSLNHGIGVTGGVPFELNSSGLRDLEFDIEKDDRTRVLCLGDSITFGTQNRLEDTYPKALERLLNGMDSRKYQVINAGGVGGDPYMEYEFLKQNALAYNPDFVILGLCLNDIGGVYYTRNNKSGAGRSPDFWKNTEDFRSYKDALKWNDSLSFMDNMKTQSARFRWYMRSKSYLFSFIEVNILKFFYRKGIKKYSFDMYGEKKNLLCFGIDDISQEAWKQLFASLADIKDLLSDRGIGFTVVVFPYEFQLSDKGKDNFFNIDKSRFTVDPQEKLLEFGKNNDTRVIDLLPQFKKSAQRLYFPLDYTHPNREGHRIAAEEIFKRGMR